MDGKGTCTYIYILYYILYIIYYILYTIYYILYISMPSSDSRRHSWVVQWIEYDKVLSIFGIYTPFSDLRET